MIETILNHLILCIKTNAFNALPLSLTSFYQMSSVCIRGCVCMSVFLTLYSLILLCAVLSSAVLCCTAFGYALLVHACFVFTLLLLFIKRSFIHFGTAEKSLIAF